MKLALNPGHYPGLDSGAVGDQYQEADLVTLYCDGAKNYLEAAGVEVEIVRANELDEICSLANNCGADVFVSVHCNSAENRDAKGTEVFCYNGEGKGGILANALLDQTVNTLGTINRGVKTNGLYVIKHTDIPAALLEVGFISNAEEEQMLKDRADDIAKAIARAVTDYEQAIDFDNVPKTTHEDDTQEGMASKYFSEDEVKCHCGCGYGMDVVNDTLLNLLDQLREAVGGPLYVSCMCRCPDHNAEVGGVRNSQHVRGNAADVIVPDGWTVDQLADAAINVGFTGVGRYYDSGFVHVDVRDYGEVGAGYYSWTDRDY